MYLEPNDLLNSSNKVTFLEMEKRTFIDNEYFTIKNKAPIWLSIKYGIITMHHGENAFALKQ